MKFIKQGDIFESSCEVIANPINCVGVMGGGLALAFKKKFPKHFETYKKMCQNGKIKVGELYVVDGNEKHKVLLFPTKIHWKNPSLMKYVESGLEYLANNYKKLGIKSVAIPALGCGLGGLKWEEVKEKIISILSELDNKVEIEIYEPSSGDFFKHPLKNNSIFHLTKR